MVLVVLVLVALVMVLVVLVLVVVVVSLVVVVLMAITVVLVVLGILFASVVADIIIFPTTKGTPIAVVRIPIKLKTAIRMYLRLNLVSVLS